MYNGIGLTTPRGSGTNGYVQKNLAFVTTFKEKVNYKTDEDVKRSDAIIFKEPNKDILLHEKKRKIEVKCFELEQLMDEKGYTEVEIAEQVNFLRKQLLERIDDTTPVKPIFGEFKSRKQVNKDTPRIVPKGTHETAAINIIKNAVFKDALCISEAYEDGSSMQQAALRKKQADESQALFDAQKNLTTLKSSDESESNSDEKSSPKKKKKKHGSHKRKADSPFSSDSVKKHHKKSKKSHSNHSHRHSKDQ